MSVRGDGPNNGFGLYVHWPYCARICPYCDFNVYGARGRASQPLIEAILADLKRQKAFLPDHPVLNSVFLGGGTPSLLAPSEMAQIVSAAEELFGFAGDVEITLEANPNDILRADVGGWRTAGVNRLSVGVQSLRDEALAFLGRDHGASDAMRAIERVRGGFSSVSIDLIYARPEQALQDWRRELSEALDLGVDHLSLYELTIEPRTVFGKQAARGALVPMDDDRQADLWELTQSVMNAAGFPAYEVSNHARSAAHRSVHNGVYWASGDWIGVGPGAHGRLTVGSQRLATVAARRPEAYIEAVRAPFDQLAEEGLSLEARVSEWLLMGLRRVEGVSRAVADGWAAAFLDAEAIAAFEADGLLARDPGRIRLTEAGRLLADAVSVRALRNRA